MQYAFPPDLQQLMAIQLASGRYANEDDVLRHALHGLQEADDDVTAVQAAIDEWKNGDDGLPVADAFDEIRQSSRRKSGE